MVEQRAMSQGLPYRRPAVVAGAILAFVAATAHMSLPRPASAQTINGTLMDLQTDQPIPLGLVIIFTESGDSVTSAVTDVRGAFSVSAPTPGSFLLLAGALGYRETPAGTFELGEDGVLDVE